MWWADLGPFRPREQTGRRPVVIWQSNALTNILQSVLVIPLTTNLDRANLAGTATVHASPEDGLPEDSIWLACLWDLEPQRSFSMRSVERRREVCPSRMREVRSKPFGLQIGENPDPRSGGSGELADRIAG